MPDIIGSEDRDILWGVVGSKNLLLGLGGNDVLHGQNLADHLEGARGDDWLYGAGGNDTLIGGEGNDVLNGGAGADLLIGGTGIDTVDYSASGGAAQVGVTVDLSAGEGSGGEAEGDLYFGIENIIGTSAADTLLGNSSANVIDAGASAIAGDVILAGGGDDTVLIGANAATADGGDGFDRLVLNLGTEGSTTGATFVFDSGATSLGATFTNFEAVTVTGTAATDTVFGGAGDDVLDGGAGRDYLRGGAGGDVLIGGVGHDSLRGGDGDDRLEGGWGNDFLVGGKGSDTFVYDDLNSSRDRIIDFQAGDGGDKLELSLLRQDVSHIHSFDDLLAHATDTAQGVYIDLAGDLHWPIGIILQGVHVADLTADNLSLPDHGIG